MTCFEGLTWMCLPIQFYYRVSEIFVLLIVAALLVYGIINLFKSNDDTN